MGDLPLLQEKAYANIDKLGLFIQDTFGWTIEKQKLYIKEGVSNLFKGSNDIIGGIFQATGATFFKMCVIPVLMFYMLYYRDHLGESIQKAVPDRYKDEAIDIVKRVSYITPRYLAGVFTVVIILSVLNSLGLFIVGLEHPIAFGIISATFTFVPYFGVWIGANNTYFLCINNRNSSAGSWCYNGLSYCYVP